jgi:hypothetical protein
MISVCTIVLRDDVTPALSEISTLCTRGIVMVVRDTWLESIGFTLPVLVVWSEAMTRAVGWL